MCLFGTDCPASEQASKALLMQFFFLEREKKLLGVILLLMTRVGASPSVQPLRDKVLRTRRAVCEGELPNLETPLSFLKFSAGKIHAGIACTQHLLIKINDGAGHQTGFIR